jgi:hypothetical protein
MTNLKAYTKRVTDKQDLTYFSTSSAAFPVLSGITDIVEVGRGVGIEGLHSDRADSEIKEPSAISIDIAPTIGSKKRKGEDKVTSSTAKRQKTTLPEKLYSSPNTGSSCYVGFTMRFTRRVFYSFGLEVSRTTE